MKHIGRNEPCPCGSGKKYKKCCMDEDRQQELQEQLVLREHAVGADTEFPTFDPSDFDDIFDEVSDREDDNWDEDFWDEYEAAGFDQKISMLKKAFDNPDLMNGDCAFEFFEGLNRSATTKADRKTFAKMVKKFKKKHPEIYEQEAAYLLDHCIDHAILDRQLDKLKPWFLEFAHFAESNIDTFNSRVDQLAYHGHLDLLREGFKIGWEKVEDSEHIVTWGIDEFAERGADYELFSYLQSTSDPKANDASLVNRMENYVDLNPEEFRKYFSHITRNPAREWSREELNRNPRSLRKNELSKYADNVARLCCEFLDFVHKEAEKSYPKADLMRKEMRSYLIRRLHGQFEHQPTHRRQKHYLTTVLCPDPKTLDECIAQLMGFMNYRIYRGIALFESVPYWLRFLEQTGLIDADAHNEVYNSFAALHEDMEQLLADIDFDDEFAMTELELAWQFTTGHFFPRTQIDADER